MNHPNSATHYTTNPDGTIAKYYRFELVKYNDGTMKNILQYSSESGGWRNSNYQYPVKRGTTILFYCDKWDAKHDNNFGCIELKLL